MSLNMKLLIDTIRERSDELENNRALMNELVVDDFMLMLGYDKKRDNTVKRVYNNDDIDWEVVEVNKENGEKDYRLIVRTFGIGDECDESGDAKIFSNAKELDCKVVIKVCDFSIKVYAYSKDYDLYKEILRLDLRAESFESNETDEKVITAISKSGYNNSLIDEIVYNKYLSYEKIRELMLDSIDNLVDNIADSEQLKNKDRVKNVALDIITKQSEKIPLTKESLAEGFLETEDDDDNTISELESKIEELEENLESIKEEKASIEESRDNILNKIHELSSLVETCSDDTDDADDTDDEEIILDKIASILKEKEAITSEDSELNNEEILQLQDEKADLENKLQALNTVKTALEAEKESIQSDKEALEIEKQELTEKYNKIVEEKEELEKFKEQHDNDDTNTEKELSKLSSAEVDAYIDQINTLTEKAETANEENKILKNKIEELTKQIDSMSGKEREQAVELLSVIQSDDDKPRQYVGVINTELYQYENLEKFVGASLQKLYQLKNFEASQYIFNGDIFELDSTSERSDLVMNEKSYGIILKENEDEDVVLNKLRIVFSHFDDIVFECKKIGTLIKKEETIENNEEAETQEADTIENEDTDNVNVEDSSYTENNYIDSNEEAESNNELNSELNSKLPCYLIVTQLLGYGDLMYTEENIEFGQIKYIGNNEITFDLRQCETLDKTLCKCIDALIAIEVNKGSDSILKTLKSTNLAEINDNIVNYEAGLNRITSTNYCISANVSDVTSAVKTLYDICNELSIDMSELFVYLDGYTDSSYIIDNYSFDASSVVIYDNIECSNSEEFADRAAILKGDMLSNIVITQNSLDTHKKIFKKVIGVKTRYMQKKIDSYDSMIDTIRCIAVEALDSGMSIDNIDNVKTLDGMYSIISNDASNVRQDMTDIQINGETFYVSDMSEGEFAETAIKLHTELFGDTAIAIKVVVSGTIYNFIDNFFSTSEPSLELAVKTLRNYLKSAIR